MREVTERFATWSIPLTTDVYHGAGHTFAGHFEDWHRPEAAATAMDARLGVPGRALNTSAEHGL